MLEKIVSAINDVVWSPVLVVLLVGAGLYFSIRTRFVQLRRLGLMLKSLFAPAQDNPNKSHRGISSFQAFSLSLSGRVGTGNIVGVATAIAIGGPGSIFWMWLIAFLGASTAFVESTLAQIYKFPHATGWRGGPACYIEKGLKMKWLAVLFAVLTIAGYGMMLVTVQSNGMAAALDNTFHFPRLYSGLGLAFVLALVIIGGIKGISRVAEVVTPFMALGYIIISIVVICCNIEAIPGVFKAIFDGAFGIGPAAGGMLGTTIMMGVKRGIFSNEAGQGGGAIVSASAAVTHPAKQGLAQAFSVYVDTLLVCTGTALMILSTGHYQNMGGNYVAFTQQAVDSVVSGFGGAFVSLALIFFVFTTLLAYYFYGESSIIYLFGGKNSVGERVCVWLFRVALLLMVVFGTLKEAGVVWQLGDIGVGITAWINVLALLILCPQAIKSLKDLESKQ